MRIIEYVRRLTASFTKDELKQAIRLLGQSLQKALDSYLAADKAQLRFKSKAGKEFEQAFGKSIRLPARLTVLGYITQTITTMTTTLELLSNIADKTYGRDVVIEGITYRRAELLRTLGYMEFTASYAVKLLHYLLVAEASVVSKEHEPGRERPKPELAYLAANQAAFLSLLQTFSRPAREVAALIESIPDITIGEDDERTIAPTVGLRKLDPLKNNFVPLVTNVAMGVGMWVVKMQMMYYDYLKDTDRSIQLRLEQLRLQAEGSGDAHLERTIEKYESYLNKNAEKIAKLEEKYL